jgi:hypothetical protein
VQKLVAFALSKKQGSALEFARDDPGGFDQRPASGLRTKPIKTNPTAPPVPQATSFTYAACLSIAADAR